MKIYDYISSHIMSCGFAVGLSLSICCVDAGAQVSFGSPGKFNDGWLFQLGDEKDSFKPEYADSTWRRLSLPHDWSIEGTYSPDLASGTGYLPGGVAWYRKHFNHSAGNSPEKTYIYFEGVYNRSDVYVNGHHLGHRPNGYSSFMYDLTPYLKDGDNIISVRVDHSRYADSRYYTGSGIYRDVYLVKAPETHIAQWGIGFETEAVKGNKAKVKVGVAIENPVKGLTVKTSLIDDTGNMVASAAGKAPDICTLSMDVTLWSIGNEVDYPNDPYSHPVLDGNNSAISQPMYGGYKPDAPDAMRIGQIARRLVKAVKEIDTSRPTTGALAGVVMSNETAYPEAVDIVGYNYTESRYDLDHKTYPDRVIYGSENRSDFNAWKAVRDRDFIFGQFIWTGIDYLGESGAWPSRGLYTGLLDFAGNPKPRGHFRASLWSDSPVVYIGTFPKPRRDDWLSIDAWDTWNYEPGQEIRVVCYTNSPKARLLLDGEVVGDPKEMDDGTGIIYWDIPFAPGNLTAQGIGRDGAVESSYSIETSGRPYAITVSADRDSFEKPGDLAHVYIGIVESPLLRSATLKLN